MLTATCTLREITPQFLSEYTKVCQELLRSQYLCLRLVTCELEDETIILRGTVNTFYLKQLAQEIARRASSLLPLRNEIAVTDRTV